MRTFHGKLSFDKNTEQKFRWNVDVDGTFFKLYIPQKRVPRPVPGTISVTICDATLIDDVALSKIKNKPISQLAHDDLLVLRRIGFNDDQIRGAGDDVILTPVCLFKEHTQTVRYRPFGEQVDWDIGEPYVPFSALGTPYPDRLVFLIQWLK